MKKIILLLTFITTAFIAAQAQTEISGYLDSDPTDGIGGAAATFDLFSAVQACRSLVHDGKTDWYLPSFAEILLFANGTNDNGTTPGCVGTNCDWVSSYLTATRWTMTFDNFGSGGDVFGDGFRHATAGTTNGVAAIQAVASSSTLYVRCVR